MEIDPANVKREMGSKPIGSGTFGTCFLATYRGIKVVVKEYKYKEGAHQSFRERLSMRHRLLANWGIILGYPF